MTNDEPTDAHADDSIVDCSLCGSQLPIQEAREVLLGGNKYYNCGPNSSGGCARRRPANKPPSDDDVVLTMSRGQSKLWLVHGVYLAIAAAVVFTRPDTGEKVVAAIVFVFLYPILVLPVLAAMEQHSIRRTDDE